MKNLFLVSLVTIFFSLWVVPKRVILTQEEKQMKSEIEKLYFEFKEIDKHGLIYSESDKNIIYLPQKFNSNSFILKKSYRGANGYKAVGYIEQKGTIILKPSFSVFYRETYANNREFSKEITSLSEFNLLIKPFKDGLIKLKKEKILNK